VPIYCYVNCCSLTCSPQVSDEDTNKWNHKSLILSNTSLFPIWHQVSISPITLLTLYVPGTKLSFLFSDDNFYIVPQSQKFQCNPFILKK